MTRFFGNDEGNRPGAPTLWLAVVDLLLPNALALKRLPIPGVKAEDPVCLGNDMPALQIIEDLTLDLPLFYNVRANIGAQLAQLGVGEGHFTGF